MNAKFATGADVVKWIEANVDYKARGHETPEIAAIWWHAFELEESIRDMGTRERMELLIEGRDPLTLEDVTEALGYEYEDDGGAPENWVALVDAGLERRLREFWGEAVRS